jgi:hypothetical protein
MNRRNGSIVTVEGYDRKIRKVLLPEGVRAADIKNLSSDDIDVLATLKVEGRKTRYYFEARGQLDAIKRLKSRGLVVAIRRGSNYAYDLSPFGYKAFELHMI